MSGSEVLKATKRDKLGTRTAKKLRAEGRIPANLQGEGHEHIDFSIDKADFFATRRHHTHLYDIDIDGKQESAVVRELQWDVFGDHILHVEFKRVIRGQMTESQVPIEFFGNPKGGVLNHIADALTISCLPSQIPDSIVVKVGTMEEGDLLRAKDVELPRAWTSPWIRRPRSAAWPVPTPPSLRPMRARKRARPRPSRGPSGGPDRSERPETAALQRS